MVGASCRVPGRGRVPVAGGRGGGDGDATLLLLLHPVHRRAALVHLANLVRLAGVVEDALGGGGLAGVNVLRTNKREARM